VTRPLRVVCATDKFKGSLTAVQVGEALRSGIAAADPAIEADIVPIADGGDGTVAAAVSSGMTAVPIEVSGPTGTPVSATIAVRGSSAVVELANTCGISLLPQGILQPLDAHTIGLGQAIAAALDARCTDIVVGVGGSASTDVGLGTLVGLGARLLDQHGQGVLPSPRFHGEIAAIDLAGLHPGASRARIRIATDVDNPLLGPHGAVAVFGPQKGVTRKYAHQVEQGVAQVAGLLDQHKGRHLATMPGMGAAGGVPTALVAILDAEVVSGAEFILDLLDLEHRVHGADLVVTGEGSFDTQTLRGKGPAAVLDEARRQQVAVAVVAGRITLPGAQMEVLGVDRWWSLLDRVDDPSDAFRYAAQLLTDVGAEIGGWLIDRCR